MVTRIEAFLDRIASAQSTPSRRAVQLVRYRSTDAQPMAGRRVAIPYFADHAYAFEGLLRGMGADASILPIPDDTIRAAGEGAGSGKECHAYAMLLGDLVRLAERSAGAPSTYMYPGTTIPCLMMQFADGFQIDLAQRGLENVTVLSPNSREMLELLRTA